ncbi:hypothetical protein PYCC9005_001368 [Savitreella phatthalungensis]
MIARSLRRLPSLALRVVAWSFIVVSVPLAFEVGGEDAGLAYTVSVVLYYLCLSTLKLVVPPFVYRSLTPTQVVVLPGLLIAHLHAYDRPSSPSPSTQQLVTIWRAVLGHATPCFTLLEGFASLLAIKAVGRAAGRVTASMESGTLAVLLASGISVSGALYFLVRITTFTTLSFRDAGLTVAAVATAGVVSLSRALLAAHREPDVAGVSTPGGHNLRPFRSAAEEARLTRGGTDRGSIMAESTAYFAYLVYSAYMSVTDYGGPPPTTLLPVDVGGAGTRQLDPLPPFVMDGWATLLRSAAEVAPASLKAALAFVRAVLNTVTASVLTSFLYRIGVLFIALTLIQRQALRASLVPPTHTPAMSRRQAVSRSPSFGRQEMEDAAVSGGEDGQGGRNRRSWTAVLLRLFTAYWPCTLVAVYTHLLLLHFDSRRQHLALSSHRGEVWRWVCIAGVSLAEVVLR